LACQPTATRSAFMQSFLFAFGLRFLRVSFFPSIRNENLPFGGAFQVAAGRERNHAAVNQNSAVNHTCLCFPVDFVSTLWMKWLPERFVAWEGVHFVSVVNWDRLNFQQLRLPQKKNEPGNHGNRKSLILNTSIFFTKSARAWIYIYI
jgi:hypothetical protein